MGSLKEYYLANSEQRHERLAESLGISWQELEKLHYEVDENRSADGMIYSYIIRFSNENDPEILNKIDGLDEYLSIRVEPWVFDHDPYQEYEFSAIADNTEYKQNFDEEIESIKQLLQVRIDGEELKYVHLRQIFISVIGAMEVYLSDALINNVLTNKKYLQKFVENHPTFKKQKLTVSEIFFEIENIEDKTKEILLETIYHKLFQVKQMYQATFEIDFPEIEQMQQYIQKRHDLVHRNGKTKEGGRVALNKTVINELIECASSLVNDVSGKINGDDIPF